MIAGSEYDRPVRHTPLQPSDGTFDAGKEVSDHHDVERRARSWRNSFYLGACISRRAWEMNESSDLNRTI
jgi:hypothetical protein